MAFEKRVPAGPALRADRSFTCASSCGLYTGSQRSMSASILCSTRQFTAAAAPATSAMPRVAATRIRGGTIPGVARNMPITAVNTMSETTRGLVSA